MNADRLLALFEPISEAPDAIPRLRRFILDLAVRGKLVEQDPEDEPAGQLLKIVDAKKQRLGIKESRRRSKSSQISSNCDSPLPCGWALATGSDIFPTRSGNSKLIKGKQHGAPSEGLYPGYSAAGQDVWLDTWEHEGDAIILSAVGARCGKAFLASGKWSAIANTHIIWMLPWITLPQYAMLLLNNEAFWIRSGGAQPFVKVRETLERPICLPPFAEQHRIVAKVDELMALCDQLEAARMQRDQCRERLVAANLQRLNQPSEDPEAFRTGARFALQVLPSLTTTPAQIKQLRQTILNLAVRGKLVAQDPEDEPAAELLSWIKAEKALLTAEGVLRKERPRCPIDQGRTPFDLPLGWAWSHLGAITTITQGFAFSSSHFTKNKLTGTPLIKIGDIGSDETESNTSELPRQDCNVRSSDILLGLSGSIRCAIWRGADSLLNQRIARIRPAIREIPVEWLHLAVDSCIASWKEETSKLTVQNIKSAQLDGALVALPPLAEQHRIVAKVDELMALCDQLEQQLSQGEESRRGLLEAVLQEALAGRLPERPEERHAAIA